VITFFTVLCVVSLVTLIAWELHELKIQKRPILNLTLFKRKTFAIPFVLMFVLGFSLYGTTVLIPQLVQTLLGYTAELAGLVISPGAICIMLMMPVVGILVGRVDPRYLICYGFTMLSISMLAMHTFSLESSFSYIMWVRVLQASGLAFLFIPINTISYIGVPREQSNDVSGLTNLARNIGGSTGTAFVATMLTRRQQAHEATMIRNLTPGNEAFRSQVNQLKGFFYGGGNGAAGERECTGGPGVSLQSVAPAIGDAGLHGHYCGVRGVLRVHDSAGAGDGADSAAGRGCAGALRVTS
jgi:DHA2 family multidrug resistance protein